MELLVLGIILASAAAVAKVTAPTLKPIPVKKKNH
jgi:hypothetical protein